MKSVKPYALWLPSWYPSKVDPLNGDFIKRHAEAVSSFYSIIVLYVVKDPKITKKITVHSTHGSIKEIIVYYPRICTWRKLERIFSFILCFYYTLIEGLRIQRKYGRPSLIHVHVFKKVYLAGWFLSKWMHLPLILSEHQSDFLNSSPITFHDSPKWKKKLISFLLNRASAITTVSQYLADSIRLLIGNIQIDIIPNVVDTKIFTATQPLIHLHSFRLIHISTLSTNKNISHIIEAVDLANSSVDEPIYHLTIVGPVEKHQAKKNVIFLSEMPQEQLAKQLTSAHALILYSTYETFGCVTIEALASGRPVILSNIPVSYELIREKEHGLIAQINEPRDLANKIIQLKQDYELYDFVKLSQYAHQKFSYEAIGKKMVALYTRLINP